MFNLIILLQESQIKEIDIIQMLTKRQFLTIYDEAVLGIRQIKNNNDKINKSIGVLNEAALHKQTEAQKQIIDSTFQKVDQSIQKMQKNYLDPDTARKIGVVKQQLRIQRDRRLQLLDNVDQITKQFKSKQKFITTQQQLVNNNSRNRKSGGRNSFNPSIQMQQSDQSHNFYKRSQLTDIGDESTQGDHQKTQVNMQLSDYDLQIQRKLIHDKNQQLQNAHARMLNIKNIVTQTQNLTYQQGERLDIIGDDLFKTYKHVSLANNQLQEANEQQKKSRKKIMALSLLLLIIIGVALFLIFGI